MAKTHGACGDTVEMFVMATGDTIRQVTFLINGCLHTHACANTVAHLSEGQTVKAAWDITPESVARYLETLPEDHFHCAELAGGGFLQSLAGIVRKSNPAVPGKNSTGSPDDP